MLKYDNTNICEVTTKKSSQCRNLDGGNKKNNLSVSLRIREKVAVSPGLTYFESLEGTEDTNCLKSDK